MYRLKSANHILTLFAAAAATSTATYSSHRCLADPPPSPVTDDFVNVAVKRQIRGENAEALPENAHQSKVLPPKLLAENVAMLTCESSADGGICNVFLIGTRHCSPESMREVRAVIQLLKPEVVFLELCPSRFTVRQMDDDGSTVELAGTLYEMPKGMTTVTNRESQSELTEAFNQAMRHGAKVILGDRPIEITWERMAANLSSWHLSSWDFIKLMYYDHFDKDGLPAELKRPSLISSYEECVMHGRDLYMSAKILEVAREHNLVVAVVGKAHLPGIQKNWKQPVELEPLLSVPKNPLITPFVVLNSVAAAAVAGLVIVYRIVSKK